MWRGGSRFGLSVAAPFVWRCPSNLAVTPFPHPAHRTGHADCPHPALGQDLTPSPTTRRAQVGTGVRDRSTRTGARVDEYSGEDDRLFRNTHPLSHLYGYFGL